MKTYIVTTAAVFGLLTGVHIWRMVDEPHLATEPWFLAITGASAVLCLWACWAIWRPRAPR